MGMVMHKTLPAKVMAVELTDQFGKRASLAKLNMKRSVVLLPFLTLCPEICPLTTGNTLAVQQHLDRSKAKGKVLLVEVSVDPARDSVSRLSAYAQQFKSSVVFARTSPEDLKVLADYFGWFYERSVLTPKEIASAPKDWLTGTEITSDVAHSDGYELIAPRGQWKFMNASAPAFKGKLPPKLTAYLTEEGRQNWKQPSVHNWTPAELDQAISWSTGLSVSPKSDGG